jgi:crotonobetainyl-CoA:carnitine CoA-transferase CaiB-like acyl-CoA transferase
MPAVMRGIRMVEVADYVLVPAAAGILSDWGADVIKIEHHERGDMMRGHETFHPGMTSGLGFNPVMEPANRGKRSIGLNLSSDAGRQVLYSLVKSADVFLTSKLEPTRKKLRFDIDDLRVQNPNIIYVRGTSRGVRGPQATVGGFDVLDYWHRSGISMGAKAVEMDIPPGLPAGAFGDNTGAMYIAGGVAAALLHRERTGEALTVEMSLLAAGMWSSSAGVAMSALFGTPGSQQPIRPNPRPMSGGIFGSSDNHFIAIACMQGFRYFPDLCRVLGVPELVSDSRFSTFERFSENGVELSVELTKAFQSFNKEELLARLADFTGQWAPVQTSLEVSSDIQAVANGYMGEMVTSTGRTMSVVQPPVQFNEAPVAFEKSPAFNEQADEILFELGLSIDEILQLRIEGAIA